jgi:predicted RND superfamily exporter protein
VIFWILFSVREIRGFVVALIPLLIGESWLLGALDLAGMKFNYANIITVPLVMALAVDYGVWFVHRRAELTGASSWVAAKAAAKAILLASGTTVAGLGAVMMARYRGVASMGVCITIGVVTCVAAALVVAPALDQLLRGKTD